MPRVNYAFCILQTHHCHTGLVHSQLSHLFSAHEGVWIYVFTT